MNLSTHDQNVIALWSAGMQALECLGIGWLVCDAQGQTLGANRIANRILRSQDGLRLDAKGILCATRAHPDIVAGVIAKVVMEAATRRTQNRGALFTVRRARGKPPLTLLARSVGPIPRADGGAQSAALVLILDPALSVHASESDLRQLYGFTARETSLATRLMDGSTLDESCHALGITRSTACTHLRRLFKKTRVHRQSELLSLLWKTIGMVRLQSLQCGDPWDAMDHALVSERLVSRELSDPTGRYAQRSF
jgi:DNA-binding CsgD family transcriptional regulator